MLTSGRDVDRCIMTILAVAIVLLAIFVVVSYTRVSTESSSRMRSLEYGLSGLASRFDQVQTVTPDSDAAVEEPVVSEHQGEPAPYNH